MGMTPRTHLLGHARVRVDQRQDAPDQARQQRRVYLPLMVQPRDHRRLTASLGCRAGDGHRGGGGGSVLDIRMDQSLAVLRGHYMDVVVAGEASSKTGIEQHLNGLVRRVRCCVGS
jgi:hypothetical protein